MVSKYSGFITTFMSVNKVITELNQDDKDMVEKLLLSVVNRTEDVSKLTQLLVIAQQELKSVSTFNKDLARLTNIAMDIMLK